MAATIKDIANKTGLGLATISSYLNGGNVRPKNREKIEQAISELHYEVNEMARGLKTNETRTIGVVIPELNNVFCTEVITEMEDVLRSHGYGTIVCDCRTDAALEKEAMEFLVRKRVDGVINMPVDTEGRNLSVFQKARKPIILIDRGISGIPCDSVLVDNRHAAYEGVRLLLDQGHRKIGILGGPREIFTAQERLLGYEDALKEAGIPMDERLICHGDYTIQGGVKGLERLVHENPEMTAVFVTNYEMTMGAVIGINELGIRIPEELSLVGFDNLEFARAVSPKLTIVTQPTAEIGREAAYLMLERLGQTEPRGSEKHVVTKLRTEIVQGKSVRKIV